MCFWAMSLSEGEIENRDQKKNELEHFLTVVRISRMTHPFASVAFPTDSLVCHPTSKPLRIEEHDNCHPDATFSPQRRLPVLLVVVS